jgi:protease II
LPPIYKVKFFSLTIIKYNLSFQDYLEKVMEKVVADEFWVSDADTAFYREAQPHNEIDTESDTEENGEENQEEVVADEFWVADADMVADEICLADTEQNVFKNGPIFRTTCECQFESEHESSVRSHLLR